MALCAFFVAVALAPGWLAQSLIVSESDSKLLADFIGFFRPIIGANRLERDTGPVLRRFA